MRDILKAVADHWERMQAEWDAYSIAPVAEASPELLEMVKKGVVQQADQRRRWRNQFEPLLPLLLEDNSHRSTEELTTLAENLSPGWAHDAALLIQVARASLIMTDPTLTAAIIWHNWHGGKAGFQFLPDPAECDLHDYLSEVISLTETFDQVPGSTIRFLTGDDRAFYECLPDRFSIYRGCSGIDAETAGMGLCWTIRREIAEWFAWRTSSEKAAPILVSARVGKPEVYFAKASEFEIVVAPQKSRQLKMSTPIRRKRPAVMEWTMASPK